MTLDESQTVGGSEEPCVACEVFLGGPEPEACTRFQGYLTQDEEEVLAMLRSLKNQAREVMAKIRGIGQALDMGLVVKPERALSQEEKARREAQDGLYAELRSCTQQLEELRTLWKEWEARRAEAHHRKMVLLGHEEWGGEGTGS
jgi:hypothetical protein